MIPSPPPHTHRSDVVSRATLTWNQTIQHKGTRQAALKPHWMITALQVGMQPLAVQAVWTVSLWKTHMNLDLA